jgi:hypothetical protein
LILSQMQTPKGQLDVKFALAHRTVERESQQAMSTKAIDMDDRDRFLLVGAPNLYLARLTTVNRSTSPPCTGGNKHHDIIFWDLKLPHSQFHCVLHNVDSRTRRETGAHPQRIEAHLSLLASSHSLCPFSFPRAEESLLFLSTRPFARSESPLPWLYMHSMPRNCILEEPIPSIPQNQNLHEIE